MPLVLPLHKLSESDASRVGAKAANLGRMIRARLPVPDGFVVAADAYRAHLSPLLPHIKALLSGKEATRSEALTAVRRAITETPVAPELREELATACRSLGADRLAVRSSGTAEDLPGHSFAGLYDTFLGPADPDRCAVLVRQCWASLWTERAFDYREQNRFDHFASAMAVVIQRLVPADAAGVVFTADPVSGSRSRIVLEAVQGLGDKLVSGEATPERFVINPKGLRIFDRPAGAATLGDVQVRSIARLALRVERLFGTPQDIEWAVTSGRVWLLQSRPITTIKLKSWEDRQVWSTTNAAEVLPGVLTPLTWSTVGDYIGMLIGGIFQRVGLSFGEHPFFAEVAGRIYMNLNTFTGMVRRMPFVNRMNQSQMFGGQNLKPEDRAKLDLSEDDLPDIKANVLKVMLKMPGFLVWILRHEPGRGREWTSGILKAYEAAQHPDPARLSEPELAARATATMAQMGVGGEGLGYALAGMMYSTTLYDLCRKWLGDKSGALAGHLLAGTGELQSAQAGIELWRLARRAAASDELGAVVLSAAPWSEVRPQLERSAAGREWLGRWDRFMRMHGHHARGELDMSNPRWRERPDYVLETVRNFIRAGARTDPESDRLRHAQERERLGAELAARLRNPIKKVVFRHVVRQAQLSASIRENVKDAAIRIIADTRALLVELGHRLAGRGVLAADDDIFFLRFREVEPATSGSAGFDIRRTIADRRAEYERNLNLNPPAIIVGRYDAAVHKPDSFDPGAELLSGLAVSPGVVTGPARVILHASAGEQVLPGEVLVAPFTDPGWTPYFIPAAGIVMDQGGLLSHGSIVAREYGIPAVVNVGPATRIIRTGQLVEVDGNTGRVRILKQPA